MTLSMTAKRRMERMLRSTWQGSLGGELLSAEPIFGSEGGIDFGSTDDSSETGSVDLRLFERDVLVAAGAQTYQLGYLPISESLFVRKNGLVLDETVDYDVDWSAGLVTFYAAANLKIGDVMNYRYESAGDIDIVTQDTATDPATP